MHYTNASKIGREIYQIGVHTSAIRITTFCLMILIISENAYQFYVLMTHLCK